MIKPPLRQNQEVVLFPPIIPVRLFYGMNTLGFTQPATFLNSICSCDNLAKLVIDGRLTMLFS